VSLGLGARADAADSAEDAVRAVVAGETAAWAKYDAKAVASFYTSDALWQNPFGVRLQGAAQLEKFLNRLFARAGYRSAKDTNPAKVTDLRFASPTVAVVWSEESSAGQIDDATGKPMAPRHSHYIEVLVKTDAGWKISDGMIMDELQLP
jgi:uncharacterized protein (TIGR02246 family)